MFLDRLQLYFIIHFSFLSSYFYFSHSLIAFRSNFYFFVHRLNFLFVGVCVCARMCLSMLIIFSFVMEIDFYSMCSILFPKKNFIFIFGSVCFFLSLSLLNFIWPIPSPKLHTHTYTSTHSGNISLFLWFWKVFLALVLYRKMVPCWLLVVCFWIL